MTQVNSIQAPLRIFEGGLRLMSFFRPSSEPSVIRSDIERVASAPLARSIWGWFSFPEGSLEPSLFVRRPGEEAQQIDWAERSSALEVARSLADEERLSDFSLVALYPPRTKWAPGEFSDVSCSYSAAVRIPFNDLGDLVMNRWGLTSVRMYGHGAAAGPPQDWGDEMFRFLCAEATGRGVGFGCGYFGRDYLPGEAIEETRA